MFGVHGGTTVVVVVVVNQEEVDGGSASCLTFTLRSALLEATVLTFDTTSSLPSKYCKDLKVLHGYKNTQGRLPEDAQLLPVFSTTSCPPPPPRPWCSFSSRRWQYEAWQPTVPRRRSVHASRICKLHC